MRNKIIDSLKDLKDCGLSPIDQIFIYKDSGFFLLKFTITIFFQLCIVTLSLFETLVSLNCEDVMLWLVFRHLIPMQHLLPSQKVTIRQPGKQIQSYFGFYLYRESSVSVEIHSCPNDV